MSHAKTKMRRRERRLHRIAAAHDKRLLREGKNPWGPDVLCGRCGESHAEKKACDPMTLEKARERMMVAREAVFAERVRRRLGMTQDEEV